MKILTINPGGTSTKIAVFENENQVWKQSLVHTPEELAPFPHVIDELDYRRSLIVNALSQAGYSLDQFACVAGRGGLLAPVESGTYPVNEKMLNDLKNAVHGEHASNLGAVLAGSIGAECGIPTFIVDPVSVDELQLCARISGLSDLENPSWFHALNQKAVARWTAEKLGKPYEECRFIIAHLGSGNSIVVHKNGRMVDGSGGRTNGPFSPERCGGLPAYPLVELCYSGKYTHEEMVSKISGHAGFYDYLGTKNVREVERRVGAGDERAALILDAYIYQVSKEIAMYAAVLEGKIDRIVLTGGIAHSHRIVSEVEKQVGFLAPIEVMAGEFEMEALALGALRVLRGEEMPKQYL